jgi:DNA-binding response OmpR family regulator
MPAHTSDCQIVEERRPRRVLLIDDNDAVRTALRCFFVRRGWDVSEASDGECARAFVEPNEGSVFDLVICDLRMPRFSGSDFYRWLAGVRPETAARLVFSTGDAHSADSADFLGQARRPVLPKPFELGDLRRIIEEVCGRANAA